MTRKPDPRHSGRRVKKSRATRAVPRNAQRPGETNRTATTGRSSPARREHGRRARGVSGSFPIVAIGASAGGLDAFSRLFAHMSPDSGMAFVLVPHLEPSHKSLMVELLARQTTMPVLEARDRMPIRPNTVYVIPPGQYLVIKGRRLVLLRPPASGAGHTPIDFALRSLAEDQGEDSIGIVLSGTGNYGTAGLREIKRAGGLVLVQDPATAEHDEMPRSALESDFAVDYVLAPEKMPAALISYSQHIAGRLPEEMVPPDARTLRALESLLDLLAARTKQNFHHYRKNMILRRVQRRMILLHLKDLHAYLERLHRDAGELDALRRDLSIGMTEFFRDPEAFKVLAARVVPKLVRRASGDAPVRIWVPACSTGEEAYSIAILFIEQFKAAGKAPSLQIFATDISEDSLQVARRGIYSDGSLEPMSAQRLKQFFVRLDVNRYQVNNELRTAIAFAPQNLISDPPFSNLDLISCRNALIYLQTDIQAKVLSLFHYALNVGGYLLLGPTESLGPAAGQFEPVSRKWRVYARSGPVRQELVSIPIAAMGGRRPLLEQSSQPHRLDRVSELMQKIMVTEFMPAAVLLNRKYEILAVQGPVVNYLEIPPGKLTHDLMAMARQPLRARIRAICHKALRKGGLVRDLEAQVRRDGRYVPCSIGVRPITEPGEAKGLLLLVFEDRLPVRVPRPGRRATSQDREAMRLLEDELHATRRDLQRTIATLESSNDDLKSSKEEVMSMNEELQCANEELETSKEELQSLNEDLAAVNRKLEGKIEDLDAANVDLTNLMAATDIAIVFLDHGLRIKRFTAPAATLLHVRDSDIGRPFRKVERPLTNQGLVEESHRVMATGTALDKEIRSPDDRWYLRRILPYRAARGAIGVVVTFIDVTDAVRAQMESRRLAAVLRNSSDAIACADLGGRITAWNRGAEAMYGYAEADAVKLRLQDLAPETDRHHLQGVLKRVAQGETVPAFETRRRTRDGRIIDVWATVTLLRDADDHPALLACTERDVTAERRAAQQIRAILDASPDAVVSIDASGRIVTFNHSAVLLFGYRSDEILGQDVGALLPPAERAQARAYLDRCRQAHERDGKPQETNACRKDGTLFPIRLAVIEIGHLGLLAAFIHDMTVAKTLQEEILNIAMLEQRRIGQELHDDTQQELTGLGLLARTLSEELVRDGPETSAKLAARLADGITEASRHVRLLAHGLVPVPVDAKTLAAALADLAQSTQASYHLSCEFVCPQPVDVGDATTATHLYRIGQEAVRNAVRHAKAGAISIRLVSTQAAIVLEVADNGVGIAPEGPAHNGVGLRLMQYRASVIGGQLTVQRQAAGGTLVSCEIPRREIA